MKGVLGRVGVMDLTDPDAYQLATGLTELRKKSGLSMSEVARRVKVHPSAVSFWECGARMPSLLYLIRLHRLLGGEWSDLLGK